MPGPPPKRDAERRRKNEKAVETTTVDIAELVKLEMEIPVADEDWHPVATQMYESLPRSGQSIFYEPSDWATAYVLCDQLSRALKPVPMMDAEGGVIMDPETGRPMMRSVPMPGASLNAFLKGMTGLMVAEGDRRRLSIELERRRGEVDLPEGVTNISDRRGARLAR